MLIDFSTLSFFSIQQQQILEKHFLNTSSPAFIPKYIIKQLTFEESLADIALKLLNLANQFAIVPISQFKVGAVAFDSHHNAYLGANFEFKNTHIGQTIHAEQSAIAHAWQLGAEKILLLAVNYPPCGHCRQFINETNLDKNFKVVLPNQPELSLEQLLPQSFGPSDLNISEKLLSNPFTHQTSKLNLKDLAIIAYKASYSPYSNNKNGIAIQFSDDDYSIGSYAENAAFNPSLPALQGALNHRRLLLKNWQDIKHIIMVEQSSLLSQKQNTEQLLQSFSQITLEYYQK